MTMMTYTYLVFVDLLLSVGAVFFYEEVHEDKASTKQGKMQNAISPPLHCDMGLTILFLPYVPSPVVPVCQ